MLRDAFGFKHVDAGGGWLIFRLPPSEIGVHPSEGPTYDSGVRHQISFMCDDIHQTIAELSAKGVEVAGPTETESYGITTNLRLPGGCDVMLYQPMHAIAADIPPSPSAASRRQAPARQAHSKKRPKKKAVVKTAAKKNATPSPARRAKKASRRR